MNVLEEAESLVNGDRLEEWGDPRESFSRIAELWSAYLGVEVSSVDVAQLMILLKVSRGRKKYSRDSAVDIAGYAALIERLSEADNTTAKRDSSFSVNSGSGPGAEFLLWFGRPQPVEPEDQAPRSWPTLEQVPDGVSVVDRCGFELLAEAVRQEKADGWFWDKHGPFTEWVENTGEPEGKPRQWESLLDVPEGVAVMDCDGDYRSPDDVHRCQVEGWRGNYSPYTETPVREEGE